MSYKYNKLAIFAFIGFFFRHIVFIIPGYAGYFSYCKHNSVVSSYLLCHKVF